MNKQDVRTLLPIGEAEGSERVDRAVREFLAAHCATGPMADVLIGPNAVTLIAALDKFYRGLEDVDYVVKALNNRARATLDWGQE